MDDLVSELLEWTQDLDILDCGADGVLFRAIDSIEQLQKERDSFHQQYVRKCEHEFEVRNLNEKLEEALRKINKRLNDDDSWLAQSIDCRLITEIALGEKYGNKPD